MSLIMFQSSLVPLRVDCGFILESRKICQDHVGSVIVRKQGDSFPLPTNWVTRVRVTFSSWTLGGGGWGWVRKLPAASEICPGMLFLGGFSTCF